MTTMTTSEVVAEAASLYSQATIPTEFGPFRILVYREPAVDRSEPREHCALVRGDVAGKEGVLARIHSECLTGEVFHSLKCDCREQLELALQRIAAEGQGVLLYLRQEGRGIGLGNKIRAYDLQAHGADTVDANTKLGFAADGRDYAVAAAMIRDLRIRSVKLMTNNPTKVEGLEKHHISVTGRVEHLAPANEHNIEYLHTKRDRMGHLYDDPELQ